MAEFSFITLLFFAVAFIVSLSLFFRFVPVMLRISAFASGVRVGLFTLVGMRFRRMYRRGSLIP